MSVVSIPTRSVFERVIARACEIDLLFWAVRTVLFAAVLGNAIDIEATHVNDGIKIGINFQAIAKAGLVVAAGLLGFYGWLRFGVVRVLQQTSVGILATLLAILYFLAVGTSIDRSVSLVNAIAFTSYVLLISTALVVVGAERIANDIWLALLLLVSMAWFCYLVVPSVGVYVEPAGAQDDIPRLTMLAHPNTAGRLASLFVIFTLAGLPSRKMVWWLRIGFALLGMATVYASLSRTAMIALVVGLSISHARWFFHRTVLKFLLAATVIGTFVVLYIDNRYGTDRILNKLLVSSSKTKDAEEITSATGRTIIWAHCWKLIKKKPLLGYGAGTSPLLLEKFSFQTHNIILNPALGLGLGGGLVVAVWLLVNLYWGLLSKNLVVSGVSIFIIVSGFTENTILPTFPEAATLSWLFVSLWPYLDFAKEKAKVSPPSDIA